jgi:hypothetical protein
MFGPIMNKCEVYIDGIWKEKPFNQIAKGDIFRMYKSGGEEISTDDKGNSVFIAKADVITMNSGFEFVVDCEKYEIKK